MQVIKRLIMVLECYWPKLLLVFLIPNMFLGQVAQSSCRVIITGETACLYSFSKDNDVPIANSHILHPNYPSRENSQSSFHMMYLSDSFSV